MHNDFYAIGDYTEQTDSFDPEVGLLEAFNDYYGGRPAAVMDSVRLQ